MLTFRHKLFATGASVVINGGVLLALAFWSPTVSRPTSDVVMEVSMEPLDLSAEIARDSAAPPPAGATPPPPPIASEPLPKPAPVSETKSPEKAQEKPADKPADIRAAAPSNTATKSPATLTPVAPGTGRAASDAPQSPHPGPAPQTAAKTGKPTAAYLALVRRHVESFKVYPKQAKRRRIEGVVTLSFTVDRQGRLLLSQIVRGSGSTELDQAALDMLVDAQPLPKPPADVNGDRIDIVTEVSFRLDR
ncbi:energy transducer TonB [Asticcacaulis sp. BYS171W]|uniref:Protein TonB n=1 Tax=Asticcacaulis aquaticus TaxID=2984212 RepID=A0ABT5HW41_9CAUL|nr:energy transducer TonB [Asticcacaulis aquaticus]MDC7684259.1 energy transducer TonB [Asticcacaulis aquaticus]